MPDGCVIHSSGIALGTRYELFCPSDMIDQVGSWSASDVGQGYGDGYDLVMLKNWINRI